MTYEDFKRDQQARLDAFPIRFAFNQSQLEKVISELGPPETLYKIPGGGFIRKTDSDAFDKMLADFDNTFKEAKQDDEFLKGAIVYELGNHEYGYTYNPTDTIECLDLDMNDARTKRIFAEAKREYLATVEL